MDSYQRVNPDNYIFVKSNVKNLYICYSLEAVYTGFVIKRNNNRSPDKWYYRSKQPLYKLTYPLNLPSLMNESQLMQSLSELDFNFDE